MEKKTIFIPIWGNWIIHLERWLSEQAACGWIVKKIDRKGFHFERRKPRTRTYMFYKSSGMHSKRKYYDPIALDIGHKITASFRATNTVEICGFEWNLASFVVDEAQDKYKEVFIQRNCYLMKEALSAIIAGIFFFLLAVFVFVCSLGRGTGYIIIGALFLLMAVLWLWKWAAEYLLLAKKNKAVLMTRDECDNTGDGSMGEKLI